VYYQVIDDPRERAQGRFFRFQTFEESDAGQRAARSARFLPTTRVLARVEFERNREAVVRETKRAMGLDRKEKELQADAWTKEAVTLMQSRKLQDASRLLRQAITAAPSHTGARQALTQVERMMKEPAASTDEYQLLVRIQSGSYETKQAGRTVSRSGDILADYIFCPRGHSRSGFQPWSRPHRKLDILRDHTKLVEALLKERNLVVARIQRTETKALSWTKSAPAGWQIEDCCLFREVREPRRLVVKDKIPFQT